MECGRFDEVLVPGGEQKDFRAVKLRTGTENWGTETDQAFTFLFFFGAAFVAALRARGTAFRSDGSSRFADFHSRSRS